MKIPGTNNALSIIVGTCREQRHGKWVNLNLTVAAA